LRKGELNTRSNEICVNRKMNEGGKKNDEKNERRRKGREAL
jgi:hypothetical protein